MAEIFKEQEKSPVPIQIRVPLPKAEREQHSAIDTFAALRRNITVSAEATFRETRDANLASAISRNRSDLGFDTHSLINPLASRFSRMLEG